MDMEIIKVKKLEDMRKGRKLKDIWWNKREVDEEVREEG
jgi:hypothetical protein